MQYILHNKGCGNVYYVQITAGGSLKKVRERSLATIFQSQSEADNIKHKYKKKLKTYKIGTDYCTKYRTSKNGRTGM